MNYSDEFTNFILKSNPDNLNNYIGTGNPNAKILIIGKECAVDLEKNPEQYEREIKGNLINWKTNIENPNQIIENRTINPLFPYKGQKFTIYNEKRKRGIGGTSDTWYKYQKLYNRILTPNTTNIIFHDSFFITELNANPSSYSKDQNPETRKTSIKERVNIFFNSDFIQNFQIIILATSHYTKEHEIDICKLFKVEFQNPTKHADKNSRQWYNIHKNIKGEKAKLLIHTKQLSMAITDILLDEIAIEVKSFSKKNKIDL